MKGYSRIVTPPVPCIYLASTQWICFMQLLLPALPSLFPEAWLQKLIYSHHRFAVELQNILLFSAHRKMFKCTLIMRSLRIHTSFLPRQIQGWFGASVSNQLFAFRQPKSRLTVSVSAHGSMHRHACASSAFSAILHAIWLRQWNPRSYKHRKLHGGGQWRVIALRAVTRVLAHRAVLINAEWRLSRV